MMKKILPILLMIVPLLAVAQADKQVSSNRFGTGYMSDSLTTVEYSPNQPGMIKISVSAGYSLLFPSDQNRSVGGYSLLFDLHGFRSPLHRFGGGFQVMYNAYNCTDDDPAKIDGRIQSFMFAGSVMWRFFNRNNSGAFTVGGSLGIGGSDYPQDDSLNLNLAGSLGLGYDIRLKNYTYLCPKVSVSAMPLAGRNQFFALNVTAGVRF